MTRETPALRPASLQECYLALHLNREATQRSVHQRCADPLAGEFCEAAENAMVATAEHLASGDWPRAEVWLDALSNHVDRSWVDQAKGGAQ